MPIVLNIDVTKIPKSAIASKPEWKGKFLKLKLVDHPKDDSDGFVAIDQTKEQREAREPSVIVGNFKNIGGGKPAQRQAPTPPQRKPADPDLDAPEEDSIPF